MKRTLIILTLFLSLISCTQEEPIDQTPKISFENTTNIYLVKVGKEFNLEAKITNSDKAIINWYEEGKIISNTSQLTKTWDEVGQKFISLKVINKFGEDEKEIRVDVAPLILPKILLAVPENGYTTITNGKIKLNPSIENDENCSYTWKKNGEKVSDKLEYEFSSASTGAFDISLTASNEDGEDILEFKITVLSPEDMPFSWKFDKENFYLSKGRKIKIDAFAIENAFDATYIWEIDGKEVSKGEKPEYIFDAQKEGSYKLKVTMSNSYFSVSKDLNIEVCPAEGTYKRARSASDNRHYSRIYEYLAAPGQFINEGWTSTTMEEACKYAEERLEIEGYVSLGGFGGYLVAGFDHSIDNDGGYNFQVLGNSFKGSSEPGIVYVMQDENGDGLPNDTWYELKGSESGKPETNRNYYVTYFRPKTTNMPVSWIDSDGKTGSIDYLQAYHTQDYYYPTWVKEDEMTLRGTKLSPRTREVTPSYWSNDEFDWGYADNFSKIDRLTDNDNAGAAANANHFKISDAIDYKGDPANLKYIDFIKVQTGVNVKAGWLGENSTEVFGIRDYNMIK